MREITKSENSACLALEEITIGHTKVINGHAVTRWSIDSYEVGTFGRKLQTIDEAATNALS